MEPYPTHWVRAMTDASLLALLPGLIANARQEARDAIERAAREIEAGIDPLPVSERYTGEPGLAGGMLIRSDNLAALAALVLGAEDRAPLAGRVKLAYLDPPFDSRSDYRSRIVLGNGAFVSQHAYADRWRDGTASYLAMLLPRLVLVQELLAPDGAVCVHLDWHASHLVRIALDELFGRQNFVNALVWSYRSGGASRGGNSVPRKHDDLLVYRRSAAFRVHPLTERQYLDKPFMGTKTDAQGRHYVDTILRDVLEGEVRLVVRGHGAGVGTGTGADAGMGADAGTGAEAGTGTGGRPVAADEVRVCSVRPVLNLSGERTGYATQKPLGLLEVLVRWFTSPGDLILDPFSGSATTAIAAQRLGRPWVAIDAGERATLVARLRLLEADAGFEVSAPWRLGGIEVRVDDDEVLLLGVKAGARDGAGATDLDGLAEARELDPLVEISVWGLVDARGRWLRHARRDRTGAQLHRALGGHPDAVAVRAIDVWGEARQVALTADHRENALPSVARHAAGPG